MSTIRDVAKQASVSVATVSRVINQSGYVHIKTKERVEKVIKQLNYQPNDVARSLYKGRSKMVALLVPDIMNPFFPQLARAVEDVASKYGYTFVLCNTDDEKEKELAYLNALRQKSVDGMIIVSSKLSQEDVSDITTPMIALDRKISIDIDLVTVNNQDGAQQAVRFLMQKGCQRIGHICGPENASSSKARLKGYLDVVKNEPWFSSGYIRSGKYGFEAAFEATKKMLTEHPDIDGLFAANDLMAVGALKAAEQLGYRVPDDLSIIGFDGIGIGKATKPAITTMAQPIYEIGATAAEMLITRIQDTTIPITEKELRVKLIERGSTRVS
ncbi:MULTISPECIES: LacI family DNA-binding transcriptional regulator [unclassified Virgibacillus]|uniref:LacI family DNA-binding transcriptional regulator n=1 Tax=unclassified Virgibacillus TaxID=2620237 RepID=UPI0024DE1742|nr:LacI family DNA-binding transcriptional regulator [Virgibacillus sp. LDC-1]